MPVRLARPALFTRSPYLVSTRPLTWEVPPSAIRHAYTVCILQGGGVPTSTIPSLCDTPATYLAQCTLQCAPPALLF
jgi:hypothetical protein